MTNAMNALGRGLSRCRDWLFLSGFVLAAVIIILQMVGVSVDVILRDFWDRPIRGMDELCEYGLLWLTFLGAAWVLRQGKHVRLDFIVTRFPQRHQCLIGIVTSIVMAVVVLLITVWGAVSVWDLLNRQVLLPTVVRPPQGLVLVIIPAGMLALFVQLVWDVFRYWTGWRQSKLKNISN